MPFPPTTKALWGAFEQDTQAAVYIGGSPVWMCPMAQMWSRVWLSAEKFPLFEALNTTFTPAMQRICQHLWFSHAKAVETINVHKSSESSFYSAAECKATPRDCTASHMQWWINKTKLHTYTEGWCQKRERNTSLSTHPRSFCAANEMECVCSSLLHSSFLLCQTLRWFWNEQKEALF